MYFSNKNLMSMELSDVLRLIIPVVSGGIIGYVTNDLAIKMLFKPYTEKHLLGFALPFTPGIIPKRQNDLARSIGEVVSRELVNSDGISKMLLSDDTIGKISNSIDGIVSSLQKNEDSLHSFACKYAGKDRVEALLERVNANVESKIDAIVSDDKIGETIAASALSALDKKMGESFWGNLANNLFADSLRDRLTPKLASLVNGVMREDGKKMILGIIKEEIDRFDGSSVSSLMSNLPDDKIASLKEEVVNLYKNRLPTELPKLLETVNVSGVVEEKIKSMEVSEMERLVRSVADKELSSLVVFGGLLGALVGLINLFVNYLINNYL